MVVLITGHYRRPKSCSSSSSSKISTHAMTMILDKLRMQTSRESTKQNYLCIWRLFNKFVIQLDSKPNNWEDRMTLFGAYMINNGTQSSTLKSYMSAIKAVLCNDGYHVDEN